MSKEQKVLTPAQAADLRNEALRAQAAERKKRKGGSIKSPERMREEQLAYNKALAAESNARGVGSQAATLFVTHGVRNMTGDELRSIKGSARKRRAKKNKLS